MLLFCLWGGEGGGGGGGGGEKYVGWVGNDSFSLSCCYFPHTEHVICHHHLKATDLQNKSSISVSVLTDGCTTMTGFLCC